MDRLLGTAQTAIEAVKGRVSSLSGSESDSQSGPYSWNEKASRFQDNENGRFVSREKAEKALGGTAVGRVIEPTTPQQQKSSGSGINKSNPTNREKPSQEIPSTLRNSEQPVRLETLFVSANQIRLARAELKRRQDEGELDEDTYVQKVSDISKHEDELQEDLIKYNKEISQDQQDFIIDFSGGSYNDILASPATVTPISPDLMNTASSPNNETVIQNGEGTASDVGTQSEGEKSGSDGDDTLSESSESGRVEAEAGNPDDESDGEPSPRSFDSWPSPDDNQSVSIPFDTTAGAEEVQTDFVITDDNPFESAELSSDPESEVLWSGLGERERVAKEIMSADSALYARYVAARERFVTDEANVRGAGISSSEQKAGWIERFRSKLPERFRNNEKKTEQIAEEFDSVYGQALNYVIQGYGTISSEEEFNLRRDLESDAASKLEWDISKTKFEATKDMQQSRARQALKLGGYALVAATAGGITAVIERYNNSGGHKWYALGAGALGALAGIGAAKGYRPQEDESSISLNSITAWDTVMKEYSRSTLDSLKERTVGIEGAKSVTKKEKRKAGTRYLGAAAIGAAAGVGGHYLVELGWPWLSSIGGIDTTNPNVQPEDIAAEAFDPLDTDHSGVVDPSVDVPDRNDDGKITVDDLFDPLDTDHDGLVNDSDIPDRNGDGVISIEDERPVEIHNPLDTDHNDTINERDIPDANGDKVIDIDDLPEETNVVSSEQQEPADTQAEQPVETGQVIYIDDGSSITNEVDQYVNNTYGIDLDEGQLDDMYADLFEPVESATAQYAPEEFFEDVKLYEMDDGRKGMVDTGHATLTPVGQDGIEDWLDEYYPIPAA